MKKVLASVFALLFVLSVFSGCTATPGETTSQSDAATTQSATTAPKASDEVVVLQYADWDNFDTAFIDEWNATHPNIQVEFTAIPDNGEKMTKIDVLAMSGELDIMPMSDAEQFIRMENGVLAPLDEYIQRDGIDMATAFGAFEGWSKYDGTYYCLPLRTSLQVVYYNKDMFDAAGIAYPSDDWTWDQYLEIAKKLTVTDNGNKIYGTYTHKFGGDWATVAVQGSTGWYTSDGLCNIKDPALVKGLQVRKDMDDQGYQMPFNQIAAVKAMPNSEFLGGKAAMAMAGSWLVRDMKNKEKFPFDFNVGIAYIPRYDDTMPGQRLSMSCSALGIPANSKHKDEAWEFIKYYITEHSDVIAKSGNIPCYQPAWNDDIVSAFIEGSGLSLQDGQVFFNPKATITTSKVLGVAAAMYNQILGEETALYFNGEKTLEQTLDNIETRVNEEIQKAQNN